MTKTFAQDINLSKCQQETEHTTTSKVYSVLEFYSGIGGMRYAIENALGGSNQCKILAAFDINPNANEVYQHNFKHRVQAANLDNTMQVDKLGRFGADIYLMSPPCQPYTRTGNQNQAGDNRSRSFLNFLEALPKLSLESKAPKYILIENVQGFEGSDTRNLLVKSIEEAGYFYQEFLINPAHMGTPNSRLRYYFLAKLRSQGDFGIPELNSRLFHSAAEPLETLSHFLPSTDDTWKLVWQKVLHSAPNLCPPILEAFFEHQLYKPELMDSYSISPKSFERYSMVYDIVHPNQNSTCCFTKGYGTYAQATGSILNLGSEADGKQIKDHRYFTEYEIGQLMGFPCSQEGPNLKFNFPGSTSLRQRYKLLGNSLNVMVVSRLIQYLLC